MTIERLNKIIEEVKSLGPDERRWLLEHLEDDEELLSSEMPLRRAGTLAGTVKFMSPDFDDPLE